MLTSIKKLSLVFLAGLTLTSCVQFDSTYKPVEFQHQSGYTANHSTVKNLKTETVVNVSSIKLEAIPGVNTINNQDIKTVINDREIHGQVKGMLVDYYFLEVKEGQIVETELDNPNVIVLIDSRNSDKALYHEFVPGYPNVIKVTEKMRLYVAVRDLTRTPKEALDYTLKLTVKDPK